MTKTAFDFDSALKAIQSGQPITGSDGVLAPLVKQFTEAALSAELDTYLADDHHSITVTAIQRKLVYLGHF